MRTYLARIAGLMARRRSDAALDDDIRAHLDLLAAEYERRGLSPEEARLAARRAFGSVEPMKAHYRDRRGVPWLDTLARDMRYAIRGLRRSPGFTIVAVLTLALGIGASTALFSVAYAYLFQKAAVRDPDSLIAFRWEGDNVFRQMSSEHAYVAGRETGRVGGTVPIGVFRQLQDDRDAVRDVIAVAPAGPLNLVADGHGDPATGQFVSGRFFDVLGVSAERGRLLVPSDDAESAAPVVVVSRQYWNRRFGMDAATVGKGVSINGVAFTIAGILPGGFRDLSGRGFPDPPDVSIPLAHEPRIRGAGSLLQAPATWWLTVLGRLSPGVTTAQAEGALQDTLPRVIDAYLPGRTPEVRARSPRLRVVSAARGVADPSSDVIERFRILAVIAIIVLLVVCVNVTNLMLSRFVSREREMDVRRAIGASRSRLVAQSLTESAVLAGLAGGGALLMALASGSLLAAVVGDSVQASVFSPRVVAFAGTLSIVMALLFGAIPAGRAMAASTVLRNRAAVRSLSSHRVELGRVLLVTQVALSFPLLVAAGLSLRTLANLQAVDIGFDPRNIVLFTLDPGLSGYDRQQSASLYERVEARLLRVPGVRAVTGSAFGVTLMDGGGVVMNLGGEAEAPMLAVEPDFFSTLGLPLLKGRRFSASDTARSPRVAIVNQTFARRFFPEVDPIGQVFRNGQEFEVVGLVADALVNGLRDVPPPTIYRPLTQLPLPGRRMIVRTDVDAATLIPAIRTAMRDVDPNLPLQRVTTQVESIEQRYLVEERMFAATSSAVGGLVLAVSAIGLFGLMSYSVARRTKELGIRMALGAQRAQVLHSVLREAFLLVGMGTLIGVVAALAVGRLLEALIFGLSRHDPLSFVVAAGLMVVAAVAATCAPARRATGVSPLVALRSE